MAQCRDGAAQGQHCFCFRRADRPGQGETAREHPGYRLDCVLFRSDGERLKFALADGMELIASGRVGVYGQRGRYQLYVSTVRPVGQGAVARR